MPMLTRLIKGNEAQAEQRRSRRLPVHLPVTLEGDGHTGLGRTVNVSAWGCAVTSELTVPIGAYIGITLCVLGYPTLEIELAAVRWTRPHQLGVEFLSLSKESRARLTALLALQMPA